MNILFLHNNFPAQFKHLAAKLATDPKNTVFFVSDDKRKDLIIPGVRNFLVKKKETSKTTSSHPAAPLIVTQIDRSVSYAKALEQLKQQGFYPDVVIDHPGWGNTFFVRDIFPRATYVIYCEWFFTKKADFDFLLQGKKRLHTGFTLGRIRNLSQLNALIECDLALSPTQWQRAQYPAVFHNKISIVHDGIDTDYFVPMNNKELKLPELTINTTEEIVTYTARGLEPYRGFPQFYAAIAHLLRLRPQCHIIIMGQDKSFYGPGIKNGGGFAEKLRKEQPVDLKRVHFLKFSSYQRYLQVLQASSVHIYLTIPYVLSWSLLEAMSCGCAIVASDTEPVGEFITHEKNGVLTDFWDSTALAHKIATILEQPDAFISMRKKARETILNKCSLKEMLCQQEALLYNAIKKTRHQ